METEQIALLGAAIRPTINDVSTRLYRSSATTMRPAFVVLVATVALVITIVMLSVVPDALAQSPAAGIFILVFIGCIDLGAAAIIRVSRRRVVVDEQAIRVVRFLGTETIARSAASYVDIQYPTLAGRVPPSVTLALNDGRFVELPALDVGLHETREAQAFAADLNLPVCVNGQFLPS